MKSYEKSMGGILEEGTVQQNQQAMIAEYKNVEKEQFQQTPESETKDSSSSRNCLITGNETPSELDNSDLDPNYCGTDDPSDSSTDGEDDPNSDQDRFSDADKVTEAVADRETVSGSDRASASAPESTTEPKERVIVKCKKCDRKFIGLKSHHKHEVKCAKTIFKCNVCQQTLKNLRYLKVHVKNIHKKSNYKCDIPGCDENFRTAFKLKVHKRTHQEGYTRCSICDKTFKNRSTMKVHKLQVHKLNKCKDNKTWSCKLCPKTFKSDRGLRYHIELHESLKGVIEDNENTSDFAVVGRGKDEDQTDSVQVSEFLAGEVETVAVQAGVVHACEAQAGGVLAGGVQAGEGQQSELVMASDSEDMELLEQVIFIENIVNV